MWTNALLPARISCFLLNVSRCDSCSTCLWRGICWSGFLPRAVVVGTYVQFITAVWWVITTGSVQFIFLRFELNSYRWQWSSVTTKQRRHLGPRSGMGSTTTWWSTWEPGKPQDFCPRAYPPPSGVSLCFESSSLIRFFWVLYLLGVVWMWKHYGVNVIFPVCFSCDSLETCLWTFLTHEVRKYFRWISSSSPDWQLSLQQGLVKISTISPHTCPTHSPLPPNITSLTASPNCPT